MSAPLRDFARGQSEPSSVESAQFALPMSMYCGSGRRVKAKSASPELPPPLASAPRRCRLSLLLNHLLSAPQRQIAAEHDYIPGQLGSVIGVAGHLRKERAQPFVEAGGCRTRAPARARHGV